MGNAKPISLTVRPSNVSHLCFEVDGIVEVSNVELGVSVPAFPFPFFYEILGSVPTVFGDPSRLYYDYLEIEAVVGPFALVALRKEARKAALHKAVSTRQNLYFAKYANAGAIIAQLYESYSPSVVNSKPYRLEVLSSIAEWQMTDLLNAYVNDGRDGVVRHTHSKLFSRTDSSGQTDTQGQVDARTLEGRVPTGSYAAPPAGAPWTAIGFSGGGSVNDTLEAESSGESSQSSGWAKQHQWISNTDYTYRIPWLENAAQYERAEISLIDQQFAQFMASQTLQNPFNQLVAFANELQSIDGDVFQLQVAFLNTILFSPIAGTVTGVYKYPGDAVKAGEPVVRVEDNSTIYLVATVIYPGAIAIAPPPLPWLPPTPPPPNSTVKVETHLFDTSGPLTPLTGTVVSARGHRDDEQWDVIVKCKNPLDAQSKPIFPPGYCFDYDNTTISIT